MFDKKLHYRAREIEAWIEQNMIDANGIMYTFVDRVSGKPLTNDVVETVDPMRLNKGTTAGWWAYENCSMVTAAYMQGLLYRYEAEGDISALARARRCFHALQYIYEIGKELEEGFMPKIYDNQFTHETSSDQILYATLALDHFHQHATPPEKKIISHMITKIVGFFVDRDYKYTFFNLKDMPWPLARFTSKTLMAYKHSGNERFKKEYERLLANGVNERPGEEQLRAKLAGEIPANDLERKVGGWVLGYPSNCAQMDLMELDYLLKADPTNPWGTKWKRSIIQMWNEGSMAISEDGRAYSTIVVDFETLECRLIEAQFLPTGEDADKAGSIDAKPASGAVTQNDVPGGANAWTFFPFMTYVQSAKGSVSTLFARAGIQCLPHFRDEIRIKPLARRIIGSFDLYDLTYFDEPEQFDPMFRYMMNLMSGDSIANWLWGYWQGRTINVFSAVE